MTEVDGTYPHADHELGPVHQWQIDSVGHGPIPERGRVGVGPSSYCPIRIEVGFIHQEPVGISLETQFHKGK